MTSERGWRTASATDAGNRNVTIAQPRLQGWLASSSAPLLIAVDGHRPRRHYGRIGYLTVAEWFAQLDGERCGRVALAALVSTERSNADPQLDLLGGFVQLDESDAPLSALA